VLFECLTGRVPFVADTIYALIAQHLEAAPPDPRTLNPSVPDDLAQVVRRAMARDPADRYQTAAELHAALAAVA
jgi:serine/threonine-protein kinase